VSYGRADRWWGAGRSPIYVARAAYGYLDHLAGRLMTIVVTTAFIGSNKLPAGRRPRLVPMTDTENCHTPQRDCRWPLAA